MEGHFFFTTAHKCDHPNTRCVHCRHELDWEEDLAKICHYGSAFTLTGISPCSEQPTSAALPQHMPRILLLPLLRPRPLTGLSLHTLLVGVKVVVGFTHKDLPTTSSNAPPSSTRRGCHG